MKDGVDEDSIHCNSEENGKGNLGQTKNEFW